MNRRSGEGGDCGDLPRLRRCNLTLTSRIVVRIEKSLTSAISPTPHSIVLLSPRSFHPYHHLHTLPSSRSSSPQSPPSPLLLFIGFCSSHANPISWSNYFLRS